MNLGSASEPHVISERLVMSATASASMSAETGRLAFEKGDIRAMATHGSPIPAEGRFKRFVRDQARLLAADKTAAPHLPFARTDARYTWVGAILSAALRQRLAEG